MVGVFYVPPGSLNKDVDDISDILTDYLHQYPHSVLLGDFNYDLLDSRKSKYYLAAMNALSLQFVPFNATRVVSLLDHIFITKCNVSRVLCFAQCPLPGVSDHDLILLTYNHRLPKPPVQYDIIKDLSKVDPNLLEKESNLIRWERIFSMANCNDQANFLSESLNSLFHKVVPSRRILRKDPSVPWFNSHILLFMKKRDDAYEMWLCNKTSTNRASFSRLRNTVVRLVRDAKRSYFLSKFSKVSNSQQAWATLKQLGFVNQKKSIVPFSPNDLNEYFTKIPLVNCCLPMPGIGGYQEDDGAFNFSLVSEFEVCKAIYSISSNAAGVDGISLKFIKMVLHYILPVLTHLFNFCIVSCSFPDNWKCGLVTPIPKIPCPVTEIDFRPIASLPVVSKAFEIIMRNQIQQHLDNKNLLSSCQSGFRRNHSTATALSKISYDIMKELNSSNFVVLVLLDFSKAFDSINHDLLSQKLFFEFGFSCLATRLLQSYLVDRFQATRVDSVTSSFLPLKTGVPQGSILGPLLFSLFINSLPLSVESSTCHLYADDCQLYAAGRFDQIKSTFDNIKISLKKFRRGRIKTAWFLILKSRRLFL